MVVDDLVAEAEGLGLHTGMRAATQAVRRKHSLVVGIGEKLIDGELKRLRRGE